MEPTTPEIAKKVSNMVRLMMKRGKILGKSLNHFMLRHHTALESFRCRSLDDVHTSLVYPLEYEFSCSSSPPRHNGRYLRHHHHHQPRRSVYVPMMCEQVLGGVDAVRFCGSDVVEPSPRRRRRPMVRRVRIKEWEPLFPFSDGEEEEWHVDKAAQEFIDKFYRDLMLQKWNTAADNRYAG